MAAPKQPFFRYDKLQDSKNEIRLLELERERHNGILQARLITTPLSTAPAYKALSYEWGTSTQQESILISGVPFIIRANLHAFFEQLYLHHVYELPMMLWVDAICINQDLDDPENDEKNHQVQLMGQIYSKANLVVAWISDTGTVDRRAAKRLLQECSKLLTTIWITENSDLSGEVDRYFVEESLKLRTQEPGKSRNSIWDLLEDMWTSSYWSRIWIVQEVAHAQNLEIYCAQSDSETDLALYFTLPEVTAAYLLLLAFLRGIFGYLQDPANGDHIKNTTSTIGLVAEGFPDWQASVRIFKLSSAFQGVFRAIRISGARRSLEELVSGFYESQCFLPQDHVYGLLSLAADVSEANPFLVNYRSDPVDLLIQTILWCKSVDSLRLGFRLITAFSPRPHGREITAEDEDAMFRWADEFRSQWTHKLQKLPAAMVTIKLAFLEPSMPGSLLQFKIVNDETIIPTDSMTLTYEKAHGRLQMVEVVDSSSSTLSETKSKLLQDMGIFRHASQPYMNPTREPASYLLDITLIDLLDLVMFAQNTDIASIRANPLTYPRCIFLAAS